MLLAREVNTDLSTAERDGGKVRWVFELEKSLHEEVDVNTAQVHAAAVSGLGHTTEDRQNVRGTVATGHQQGISRLCTYTHIYITSIQ